MRRIVAVPLLLGLVGCSSKAIVLQRADPRAGLNPPFVQTRPDGGWLLLDTEGRVLRFDPSGKPLRVLTLEAAGRTVCPSLVCETPEGSLYAAVPERSATALMKFDGEGTYLQTVALVAGSALSLFVPAEKRLVLVTLVRSAAAQVRLFVDDLPFHTLTFGTDLPLRSVHPLPDGRLLLGSEAGPEETFAVLDLRTERLVPLRFPRASSSMPVGVLASGRLVLVEPTGPRRLRVHIVDAEGGMERTFLRRVRPLTLSGRLLDPVCPVGDRLFELRVTPGRLKLVPLP